MKRSLEEAEVSLRDWVERLQTRFIMLPHDLHEELYAKMTAVEYKAKPMRALQNHISMMKIKLNSTPKQDGPEEEQFKLAEEPGDQPEQGQDLNDDKKNNPKLREFWKDIIPVPVPNEPPHH
jgi:hypothetical protein